MPKGKGTDIEMMPLSLGRKTVWHLQKKLDCHSQINSFGILGGL